MNIYIDVSHIMGWKGVLTGIERVEYHIIKHYINIENASFIYWDNNKEVFNELDRYDLVNSVLDKSNKQTHSKKAIKRLQKFVLGTKKATLNKDDILIVLAGLWDDDKYINTVATVNINIVHIVYDMIPIVQPAYVVDFVQIEFYLYMSKVMANVNIAMSISVSTQNDLEAV
jgi:hypothetical protein